MISLLIILFIIGFPLYINYRREAEHKKDIYDYYNTTDEEWRNKINKQKEDIRKSMDDFSNRNRLKK
jgi:hypothetical protein